MSAVLLSVMILAMMAALMYSAISILERKFMKWQA